MDSGYGIPEAEQVKYDENDICLRVLAAILQGAEASTITTNIG